MTKQSDTPKTNWHHLIGALLQELLTPVGITVHVDMPVMSEPPEADIILLRREGSRWTKEQKAHLPDGIRDSRAAHILIEFKYSESLNEDAIHQALAYNYFYRKSQNLKKQELQTFLMVSKTPQDSTLTKFDWHQTEDSGIYESGNSALNPLKLILLNRLSNEEHNAWVKCFASKKKEKVSAFSVLTSRDSREFSKELYWLVQGLLEYCNTGGDNMKEGMTPEKLMEQGRKWQNLLLAGLEPEELLARLKPNERLKGLKPKERLAGLSREELKELEAHLKELNKTMEQ